MNVPDEISPSPRASWNLPPPVKLDLPPPPPPPPPALSHTADYQQPDYVTHRPGNVSSFQRRHEDLRILREELLGCRFQMQSDRSTIRDMRQQTGAKEGAARSRLRRFLHESAISLPQSVEEAFEEVDSWRDRLGIMEADFDEAERSFNLQEVRYTQKEEMFVDDLCIGQASSSEHRPTDTMNLNMRVEGPVRNEYLEPGGSEIQTPIPTQRKEYFDHDRPRTDHPTSILHPTASFRSHNSPFLPRHDGRQNEFMTTLDQPSWREKKVQINEWLLDMISQSPLQQAHLKAMNNPYDRDTQSWWQNFAKTWKLDTEASTQVRGEAWSYTQDIASGSPSVVPIAPGDPAFEDSGAPVDALILPGEQFVGIAGESGIPASIGSSDLRTQEAELGPNLPQRKESLVESTESNSTEPETSHQTFSMEDVASVATRASSYLNLERPAPIAGGLRASHNNRAQPDRRIGPYPHQTAQAIPRQPAIDRESHIKDLRLSGPVMNARTKTIHPREQDPAPATTRISESANGRKFHSNILVSSTSSDHTLNLGPGQIPLPLSPGSSLSSPGQHEAPPPCPHVLCYSTEAPPFLTHRCRSKRHSSFCEDFADDLDYIYDKPWYYIPNGSRLAPLKPIL